MTYGKNDDDVMRDMWQCCIVVLPIVLMFMLMCFTIYAFAALVTTIWSAFECMMSCHRLCDCKHTFHKNFTKINNVIFGEGC